MGIHIYSIIVKVELLTNEKENVMKQTNKQAIVKKIYQSPDPITAAEIAESLHKTPKNIGNQMWHLVNSEINEKHKIIKVKSKDGKQNAYDISRKWKKRDVKDVISMFGRKAILDEELTEEWKSTKKIPNTTKMKRQESPNTVLTVDKSCNIKISSNKITVDNITITNESGKEIDLQMI